MLLPQGLYYAWDSYNLPCTVLHTYSSFSVPLLHIIARTHCSPVAITAWTCSGVLSLLKFFCFFLKTASAHLARAVLGIPAWTPFSEIGTRAAVAELKQPLLIAALAALAGKVNFSLFVSLVKISKQTKKKSLNTSFLLHFLHQRRLLNLRRPQPAPGALAFHATRAMPRGLCSRSPSAPSVGAFPGGPVLVRPRALGRGGPSVLGCDREGWGLGPTSLSFPADLQEAIQQNPDGSVIPAGHILPMLPKLPPYVHSHDT